jgi:pilus assembly protein TadC
MSNAPHDPVRALRQKVARYNLLANRIGYLFLAVSMSCFVMAFAFGFKGPLVTVVIVTLIIGSILLAPSIVIGYAVKAAERDDREKGL